MRVLNSLLMAVRLEVKSLSDTNTASFTEPSVAALPDCLALLLPALFSRLHPHVPLVQPGARVRGNPSPRSTAVCLRNQETSKICRVTVAVKSALFLQLPLLLAAAINLVEATSVMFESNFVKSNLLLSRLVLNGCHQEESHANNTRGLPCCWTVGKKWGKRRQRWVCSLKNRKRKKHPLLKSLRFLFLQFKTT